jgi:hypothetical protein
MIRQQQMIEAILFDAFAETEKQLDRRRCDERYSHHC